MTKGYMVVAKMQEEDGEDLSTCMFKKIHRRANDRVSIEECLVELLESTSRCRTALLALVDGLPMGSPSSSSVDSVRENADR